MRLCAIRKRIAKLGLKIKTIQRAGVLLYSDTEEATMIGDLQAMLLGKAAPCT